MVKLISVHVPKCGGQSLGVALRNAYGREAMYEKNDQLENPLSIFNMDPASFMDNLESDDLAYLAGKQVVHGHFYIERFRRLRDALRITVLRDPVERVISHYNFWHYSKPTPGPLRQYLLDNQLTLLQFARLPNIRYYYTRIFFRDVDMAIFDFIGNYTRLEGSVAKISGMIGKPLVMPHQNKNTAEQYATYKAEFYSNPAKVAAIRDMLRDDIAFYERWG